MAFMVTVLVAVVLAVFITNELVNVALPILAVVLITAGYVARQYARDRYVYHNRDDR
jgi:hypothetical protein